MVHGRVLPWLAVATLAGCSAEGTGWTVDTPPAPTESDSPAAALGADSVESVADDVPGPVLTGQVEWARGFAGFGDNAGRAVSVSPEGHVLLTGSFWPAVDFGGGELRSQGYDAVNARYSSETGTYLSSTVIGGPGNHEGRAAIAGGNGIAYLAGSFSGELEVSGGLVRARGATEGFVTRVDGTGRTLSVHTIGGPHGSASINSMVSTRDGSLYVSGWLRGSVEFGDHELVAGDDQDGFVARIDVNGTVRWVHRLTSGQRDTFDGLAAVTVTDLSGARVDQVVVVGTTDDDIPGDGTGVVRMLDRQGRVQWSDALAGGQVNAIATDSLGRVFIAGAELADGVQAGVVVRYDQVGARVWTATFAGTGNVQVNGLAVDPQGRLLVTGGFENELSIGATAHTSAGGSDIFVAKLDGAGSPEWSHSSGWLGDDRGLAIAARRDSGAVVTGQYSERIDFGFGRLPHSAQRDIFLLGLAP